MQICTLIRNEGAKGIGKCGPLEEPHLDAPPTLSQLGIDKKLSSRAQKRLLGEMLGVTERNSGAKGQFAGRDVSGCPKREQPENVAPPTLPALGIDRKLSSRAQKLASVPVLALPKRKSQNRRVVLPLPSEKG
jgi:hypothetical protein